MRVRLRDFVALAFVALGSGAACSVLVANQFSGYGDTCELPNPNNTKCGTCIASNCQSLVNAHCGEDLVSDELVQCISNPSPGVGESSAECNQFVGDAAFVTEDNDFPVRTCVSTHCTEQCTECTVIDAGTTPCGTCIMSKCGSLLNGANGCCSNSDVNGWISDCVFTGDQTTTCNQIDQLYTDAGNDPSLDASDCETQFAACVHMSCVATGKCN